jgi:hypothetical protein
MRYSLRTLLSRLAAGPPIVESITESYGAWRESQQGTRRTGFRFSIRDILWLTLVVAMACALLLSFGERRRMARRLSQLESASDVQEHLRKERALIDELERVTGRPFRTMRAWKDPTKPTGYKWQFEYGDTDSTESEPNP